MYRHRMKLKAPVYRYKENTNTEYATCVYMAQKGIKKEIEKICEVDMPKPYSALNMIAFHAFVLILTITRYACEDECKESKLTAKTVPSCPRTNEEWREAVLQKNCSQFFHSCSSFEYHCVINAWKNETIEVCAPNKLIVGRACAEFSYGGNRIQRHSKAECKKCPVVYYSIDSYKYQECYKYEARQWPKKFKNSQDTEAVLKMTVFSKSTDIMTSTPKSFPIGINNTLMSRLYINSGGTISMATILCMLYAVTTVLFVYAFK